MKLVQLQFEKPCYKSFLVVVEVPNDFPEDSVHSLLCESDLLEAAQGCEIYDTVEPAKCATTEEISPAEGSPHYRFIGDKLEKV
jgi:hypothetical protein